MPYDSKHSGASVTDIIRRYGLLRDDGLRRQVLEECAASGKLTDQKRYSQPIHETFVAIGSEYVGGKRPATTDISSLAGIPKSTARYNVSYLEQAGIVARLQDPSDGRRHFIELTKPYQEIVDRFVVECTIEFADMINLYDKREREAAEEALLVTDSMLQESEDRYRRLFDNSVISCWDEDFSDVLKALNQLRQDGVTNLREHLEENENLAWDMAGMVKVTHVNKATLNMFKARSQEEFVDSIDKLFGPDAIDTFISELCAIWDRKALFQAEAIHHTLEGDELTVLISMAIPETDEGFSSVSVSLLDITERNRAAAALKTSEARLQAILDNSSTLISMKDREGNVLLANRQFDVLEGPSSEEFVGRNVFDLFPKEIAEALWENDVAALKSNAPIEAEETVMHKDGKPHTYLTIKFPVRIGDEEPFGTCAISTDITERKQLERELRQSRQS